MELQNLGPFLLLATIFVLVSLIMKKIEKWISPTVEKKKPRTERGISITFTFEDVRREAPKDNPSTN